MRKFATSEDYNLAKLLFPHSENITEEGFFICEDATAFFARFPSSELKEEES
jgi:hypothetical protein